MAAEGCPWRRGSKRQRFYRPDWGRSPDCQGCLSECDGRDHRCHLFGIPGFCEWPPGGITMSNWTDPWWYPGREPGLAESWLPPQD